MKPAEISQPKMHQYSSYIYLAILYSTVFYQWLWTWPTTLRLVCESFPSSWKIIWTSRTSKINSKMICVRLILKSWLMSCIRKRICRKSRKSSERGRSRWTKKGWKKRRKWVLRSNPKNDYINLSKRIPFLLKLHKLIFTNH